MPWTSVDEDINGSQQFTGINECFFCLVVREMRFWLSGATQQV